MENDEDLVQLDDVEDEEEDLGTEVKPVIIAVTIRNHLDQIRFFLP